jgi:hypothetical protein
MLKQLILISFVFHQIACFKFSGIDDDELMFPRAKIAQDLDNVKIFESHLWTSELADQIASRFEQRAFHMIVENAKIYRYNEMLDKKIVDAKIVENSVKTLRFRERIINKPFTSPARAMVHVEDVPREMTHEEFDAKYQPKPNVIRYGDANSVRWRDKQVLSLTGYKWCGPGHQAESYGDLSHDINKRATDACCRKHDHCPIGIRGISLKLILDRVPLYAGSQKEPVYKEIDNTYTVSDCECDREFYNCLHRAHKQDPSNKAKSKCKQFFKTYRMDCIAIDPHLKKWTSVENPIGKNECDKFDTHEPSQDIPTPAPHCDSSLPPGRCRTPLRGEYKELFNRCDKVTEVGTSALGKTQQCYISKSKWLESRPCYHRLGDHCTNCTNACACYIEPHVQGEDPYFLARITGA